MSAAPPPTLTIDGLELDIADLTATIEAAGDRSLRWWRQPVDVVNKAGSGDFDPVTEADRAVESLLRDELARRHPDHAVLGEELGSSGESAWRWVIDPIDGTRAFVSGLTTWGTLVGLQHDDRVVAGWMRVPAMGETYLGLPDGAWLLSRDGSSRPLSTSRNGELGDATVMATHPDMFSGSEVERFRRVEKACRLSRFGGDCTQYGILAMGFCDLVIEASLQPYDIIPVIPLVEAAGGIVTAADGGSPLAGGFTVAAANPQIHAAAIELLNR